MPQQEQIKYDYIIAGSGCAGLSLLYRILNEPTLKTKTILVLDSVKKNSNDRTWCYWETEKGLFDSIVTHEWKTLEFLTPEFTQRLNLEHYSYKMIKGIDFYNHVLSFAKTFKNVTFKLETIQNIQSENNHATVKTKNGTYTSDYVFNSTSLFNPTINTKNALLQHFEGWVIKTNKPTFNAKVGTLMDFRLNQDHGATFMYVLPTSAHEALIEYTLFSEKLLDKAEYKSALEQYINDVLNIAEYDILHKEFGVIPMSLAKFSRRPKSGERIINIGTAGGFTKASSGYTFQFIQKNTKSITHNLITGKHPYPEMTFREKMFQWYDRTVLEVMISKRMTGKEIFSIMFKNIPAENLLKFLGNESRLVDDIKIMNKLPKTPFLIAGMKRLL
ncbi:lycopene cyclase family protein [Formosa sp. 4Alg 33]|uniref:lycopene cyclase family protein n=1 Tax=Formosa sp. 4Alg 33 TaxID=3382189 RepID=UPI003D9C3BA3